MLNILSDSRRARVGPLTIRPGQLLHEDFIIVTVAPLTRDHVEPAARGKFDIKLS